LNDLRTSFEIAKGYRIGHGWIAKLVVDVRQDGFSDSAYKPATSPERVVLADQGSEGEVSEQHQRAGSALNQTDHVVEKGLQIIRISADDIGRDRNRAHHLARASGRPRGHCIQTVQRLSG
jgi:hypothetical protein